MYTYYLTAIVEGKFPKEGEGYAYLLYASVIKNSFSVINVVWLIK
jgi:hypothetical protein